MVLWNGVLKSKQGKKMKTISAKLLIPILAAVVLGNLITGYIGYRTASDVVLDAVKGDGQRSAHSVRVFVDSVISRAQLDLFSLAALPAVQSLILEGGSPAELEQYMIELVNRFGTYNSIIALNAQGTIVASTSGSTGGERADRDYFIASMSGEDFIGNVDVSRQTGRLSTFISIPVRQGAGGPIIGVVMTSIRIEELSERYVIPVTLLGGFGHAMIANGAGIVVGHRDIGMLGETISEEMRQQLLTVDNNMGAIFETVVDGIPSMIFIERSSYTDWFSIVVCPIQDFHMTTNYLARINIILSVIVTLLLALVILYVVSRITRPISTLLAILKDISQGEGDLTKNITINSKDEIGDLARHFNQTLVKIKNLVITIRNQAMNLQEIGDALVKNMGGTATEIKQITDNIQSIKSRIINQSASVSQTHDTMEQVVSNINKLNNHVQNQSSNLSVASSAIEQMVANISSVTVTLTNNAVNVNTLKEASEVGRSGLSEVASDIQEIARESEGLLEINSVMENIASQTNLLSMNAAIEAAHAGDAGKGFAVVADEIRKLAESSSGQSKTIGTVLKKIKESIDKITRSTENVLTKFEAIDSSVRIVSDQEENIRNAMDEQGNGSKQILQSAGDLNEITRQVRSGSDEMLVGSKEVIQESTNLEKSTQEITSEMNKMASGAEQINLSVTHVNELCGKTREGIDVLIKEVSLFKVE